jgi:hypothetical protein
MDITLSPKTKHFRNSNVMVTTIPDLGGKGIGFTQDLPFIAFKSIYKPSSRYSVFGTLSWFGFSTATLGPPFIPI